jgi:hypothetical protein
MTASRAWTAAAVLLVAASSGLGRADGAARVDALRAVYDAELSKLSKAMTVRQGAAVKAYGDGLVALQGRFQGAGELESLLSVRAERERFGRDMTVPDQPDPGAPVSLRKLNRDCRAALDAVALERSKSVVRLTERYMSHLSGLVKQLTRDRKIEDAIAVRQEVETAKAGEAYQSARFALADHAANAGVRVADETPGRRPPSGAAPAGAFCVAWRPRAGNAATVSTGKQKRAAPLRHEGRNQSLPSCVLCQGGRTFVEGVGEELAAACKKSNELTIGITLTTRSLDQTGPARILSCSLDGHHRNFSLCQEGESFVLRLRTTQTGVNGASPEVRLCPVRAREDVTLLITYRPGELRLLCDGREMPVRQIAGDFSNWEEYPLLLGNEWREDRVWSGRVLRFFVADRCLGKIEAQRLLAR